MLGLGLVLLAGCPADDPSPAVETSGASEASTSAPVETESGVETESSGGESETGEDETGETGEPEPEGNLLLSDKTLNNAHRGGARLRPEATLVAFEHALEVGADVLEFDLHGSADGVIVVIHDSTVDRTTDGSGAVKDMSFDELRALDAGYAFSNDGGQTFPYRGMGIQIPTPEEVFDSFPDQYYLMEIKQVEPSIVPTLVATILDYGIEERVVIASFNQVTIDEVRETAPELFTAFTAQEMIAFNQDGARPDYVPPSQFIQPPWDFVDQELVDIAHALGMKVHPWTVNSEDKMVELIGYGVDGIMTDDPVLLDAALGLP